ncbi:hypothetical protein ACFE04_005454 [Oxalis oulophora]
MDARRGAAVVPKVRQVGFFTPNPPPPNRSQSGPLSPPISDSPAGNSLSPVMIPPARHHSDNLSRTAAFAVPAPDYALLRRPMGNEHVAGSYNPPESVLGSSSPPVMFSPMSRTADGDGDVSVQSSGVSPSRWYTKGSNPAKFASSFPSGGFDLTASAAAKPTENPNVKAVAKNTKKTTDKSGNTAVGAQNEPSKPLKAKTTKAERRALQEAQRAAKATNKGEGNKPANVSGKSAPKPVKQPSQKTDAHPVASSVKGSERLTKKDVPAPRMQFDDKSRVEKAKKRSMVNQREARHIVELFRHLPQYEHGTLLPNLESKFFELDPMHPAVYKVGLDFLSGHITTDNARCIAMLHAFQEVIKNYTTPAEKTLTRDLTAKLSSYVSFLTECRPLCVSMGNAIRFLKNRIAKLSLSLSESEAKASLLFDIDRFINERIVLSHKVIVEHAFTKIRDGDVILTHGSSCVIEMVLLYAHEFGKKFRVIVVDSRPKLEGQTLLRRLVEQGLSCTYTHINALSYIMHEVSRVFLGASSVLSNGTVYSTVGTASVAMVANAFRVPVIFCCEAYKFHERVQLDSICSNELGDPDVIAKIPGATDENFLAKYTNNENLQLLNLMYDITPSDYVSMIITDYGMIPPTSVPVIVREYGKEHLF